MLRKFIVHIHNPATGLTRRRARVCEREEYVPQLTVLAPSEFIARIEPAAAVVSFWTNFFANKPAGGADLFEFYSLLLDYMGVNPDMARALEKTARQVSSPAIANASLRVLDEIRASTHADNAFEQFRDVLPDAHVEALKAGRTAGSMKEVVERLSKHSKSLDKRVRKVKRALVYPMIVIFTTCVIVAVTASKQLPAMVDNFKAFGATPTGWTARIFEIGIIIRKFPFLPLILPIGFILIYFNIERIGRHPLTQRILFKYPFTRRLLFKMSMSDCLSVYTLMSQANVGICTRLEIAARQSTLHVIAGFFRDCAASIQAGTSTFFLAALQNGEKLGPDGIMFVELLQTADENGTAAIVCERIAERYQDDTEDALENINTIISPLLIIFCGFLIAGVLLMTIIPMADLNGSLVPSLTPVIKH